MYLTEFHDTALPKRVFTLTNCVAGAIESFGANRETVQLGIYRTKRVRKCDNYRVRLPDGQSLPETGEESPVSTGQRAG